VLLVASANLVNLFLARQATRSQETAVRLALGASRGRILLRGLIESSLISAVGTAAGIGLGAIAIEAAARWAPAGMPWLAHLRPDFAVLSFGSLLGALTAVALGVLPATQSRRATLARQDRPGAVTPRGHWLRRMLCAAELAVAIVLLVGGLLLGRSLVRLLAIDIGVNPDHVTTASVNLDVSGTHSDAQKIQLVNAIVARLRALPGVRGAGIGTAMPPDSSGARITMRQTPEGGGGSYAAEGVSLTPGYLPALGVRLQRGRFFTAADDGRHGVIIMSAQTARRFFGNADPLGRATTIPTLLNGRKGTAEVTLVGIIADVKYAGLTAAPGDQIYEPFAQQPWSRVYLAVRTDGDPADFPSTVRRAVASVDPTVVLSSIQTLDAKLAGITAPPRFRAFVLDSFAGLCLAVSAIGLYGVIAYSVAQRTMEIGIRMALGARTADVMGMVLREGAMLGVIGAVVGLGAAYAVTRLLASLLYGVTPTDPISFALAAVILLIVAFLASYLPARRAAQVDPLVALKAE
jgi:predicted permease